MSLSLIPKPQTEKKETYYTSRRLPAPSVNNIIFQSSWECLTDQPTYIPSYHLQRLQSPRRWLENTLILSFYCKISYFIFNLTVEIIDIGCHIQWYLLCFCKTPLILTTSSHSKQSHKPLCVCTRAHSTDLILLSKLRYVTHSINSTFQHRRGCQHVFLSWSYILNYTMSDIFIHGLWSNLVDIKYKKLVLSCVNAFASF